MRVLHCIASVEGGGAERQLTYLVTGLQRAGVDVHVALTRRGANWDRLLASGATIHELPTGGAHNLQLVPQLVGLIRRVAPDLVQGWLRQMDIAAGAAAAVARRPFVLTERAVADAYPRSIKHALRRLVGQRAAAIVANSGRGADYWSSRAHPVAGSHVIPNVVPLDEIEAASPAGAPLLHHRRIVLFAGRLEPQKNILVLLPALSRALSATDAGVVICGTGTMRPHVAAWIEANHLQDRVALPGYVPDLWSLMKRAAVLVSPALFEGSPNVVLEAMACRLPLIVSDIPEHRERLDERTAILVDPSSANAIADAIVRVLNEPKEAAARADEAQSRIRRFSVDEIARQYRAVYGRVLSAWSARR